MAKEGPGQWEAKAALLQRFEQHDFETGHVGEGEFNLKPLRLLDDDRDGGFSDFRQRDVSLLEEGERERLRGGDEQRQAAEPVALRQEEGLALVPRVLDGAGEPHEAQHLLGEIFTDEENLHGADR